MTHDSLAPWERWPVAGLLIAAGINTAVWYVGASLAGPLPPPAQWMLTAGGATAILAIDGALVATVAGMREGRRSRWSTANVLVTALFTAAAALSAHGVVDGIGGALHALFAATIVTYAMHLAQPRSDALARLALREQEVARQAEDVARREADLARALTPIVVPDAPRATLPAPTARQKPAGRATRRGGDDDKATVLRLVASGLSASAAARQAGVKPRTAQRWTREEG